MKNIFILAIFISSLAFAATGASIIDVSGTWHEIARYENSKEKGCVRTRFIVENLNEGKLKITQQCLADDNTFKSIFTKAYFTNEQKNEVAVQQFFYWFNIPWLQTKLTILDHSETSDPNESYLIVTSKNKNSLWILSRNNIIDPVLLVELLKKLQGQGYDLRSMIIDNSNVQIEWPR